MARATGMTPISQVMGASVASVMHVGFSGTWAAGTQGFELTTLTRARHEARRLALGRMRNEAKLLGAHVVVGVAYREHAVPSEPELVEIVVTRTAMRLSGSPHVDEPPLTTMDADELWKIHMASHWPVGVAMGSCFWFEPHCDCASEGNWTSGPMPSHTRAVRTARKLAQERFREFARWLKADGVVGVRVRKHMHGHSHEGHTQFGVEFLFLGTAVVRRGTPEASSKPRLILDLAAPPGQKPHHSARRRI